MPLSKSDVEKLVLGGSNEQTLQAEVKKDLSIMAEVYANPKREYIAFPEFPVGQGSVDFVLLTSRSRMSIFLIEVKGADFTFINKDRSVAAPINLAAQQVRERFAEVQKNYEGFRRSIHEERRAALNGSGRRNALVGPDGLPNVSSDKDIDLHGVVIGGRTLDDDAESKIKHDMEWNGSPRVTFESWESWLRKLTRQ